jgi:large subunit ribosomal protein L9
MEIILLQDVKNLGYKNEIIKVKNGYANNYLIPNGIAIVATSSARKVQAETLKQQSFKADRLRQEAEVLKDKINGLQLNVMVKASTTGKIFGSVNNIMIADALKNQHEIDIDRKQIHFEPVKQVGTYTASILIFKNIEAECTFEVIAE